MKRGYSLLACVLAVGVLSSISFQPASAAAPANDNACNSGYTGSGDWTGNNGGNGFGAWSGKITTGGGLFKRGNSGVNDNNSGSPDIDTSCSGGFSWGMNAGGGGGNTAQVTRVFTQGDTASAALLVGQVFTIDMDNGWVDNNNPAGFSLQNSSGETVFDFRYLAGQDYQTNALAPNSSANTGIGYTGHGLRLFFTLTATNACQFQYLKPTNSSATNGWASLRLLTPAHGQAIDRVTMYARGIGGGNSSENNHDLYFNSMSIGCPAFTATVPNTNVCSGSAASFSVSASTLSALAYQWQQSTNGGGGWSLVAGGSGATTATYVTPTTTVADNGKQYRVILSDACVNVVTSSVAVLTVAGSFSITTQPSAQAAYAGGNATFTVVATGTNYQWYKGPAGSGVALSDGGSISGATSATLNLSGVTTNDNNTIFYVVVGGCGGPPQTSNGATLTVFGGIDPFLKTNGINIRNGRGAGDIVPLHGVNLGAWLLMEGWMCPMDSGTLADNYSVIQTLDSRFGVTTEQSLIRTYQTTWITTNDLDNIRALGKNLVRVPIWWADVQSLDGTWRADAFDRLDWVVSNAWQRGIYTLIDFHGVPGGQSSSQSTGQENLNQYWTSTSNQNATASIWSNIAAHFRNNAAVAGYDLMNEPSGAPTQAAIWTMYNNLYQTVRAVDPDHICVMEGTWSGTGIGGQSLNWQWDVLPTPTVYNWSNVVYSMHAYPGATSYAGVVAEVDKQVNDFRNHQSWNVPALIGEFQAYGISTSWLYAVRQFTTNGMSWANWAYKSSNGTVGNSWGVYDPTSSGIPKPNISSDSATTISNEWSQWKTIAGFGITPYLQQYLGEPLAVADAYTATSGVTLSVSLASGVLANDIDINSGQSGIEPSAVFVDGPANGQLNFNTNGAFTYTANAGFAGLDSFRYRVYDNYAYSVNIGTVLIQVNPPPVPAAPTGLTATGSNGVVFLIWNSSLGATNYNLKRGTISGGPYTLIDSNVATTSDTDSGVVNGTT